MPQPSLNLGNVGLMLQSIGGGSGSQTVHTQTSDLNAGALRIMSHQSIDAIGSHAGAGVSTAQRYEERSLGVCQVML